MKLEYGRAICYSGYREGQNPGLGIYPTHDEVKQDLQILANNWQYLRLYDCGPHAQIVIDVIEQENLPFKLMLGADIAAEQSNPNCPWDANYDEQHLVENRIANEAQIAKLIEFANKYPSIIGSVSIGNEASVDWTDHLVPVERLVYFASNVKANVSQPVTFCENYVPWHDKLAPLVEVLDFISIHTYPAWEYQTSDTALEYTKQNYHGVASRYPDKQIVITEAGWTTASNGQGIETWNASPELQAYYYHQLLEWIEQQQIVTFFFEAFDEPWKGSDHEFEPEKHWGLFYVDRSPKLVMKDVELVAEPN